MTSLFRAAAFALAAAAMLAAPAAAQETVALTAADDGSEMALAAGDTLTLALPTKGGVPYVWMITSDIEPQLAVVDQQNVAATPGRLGVATNAVFTFEALQPGTVTLTAGYYPVSGEGDPQQEISIEVTVE